MLPQMPYKASDFELVS